MTELERIKVQNDWQAELAKQGRHAVYLPVRARWDLPWDERGIAVELGVRLAVDESRLEFETTDAVRDDPWLDESFVLQRTFVAAFGAVPWADGVPRVPWEVETPDGMRQKPLRLLMQARAAMCRGTENDPYSGGWISEGHRAIFIEMCKLRLLRPGEVLELLLLGGNRGGKTYVLLALAVMNWMAAPRPEGAGYGPAWKARLLIMHGSENQSCNEHQVPFYYLMPKSVREGARSSTGRSRLSKTEDTVFNFTGSGFTNGIFNLPVEIAQEDGEVRVTGGEVRHCSYNGAPNNYEGPEYNFIMTDEEVQAQVYENQKRGMTSRAVVTNEKWFLTEISRLLLLLEAGTPMGDIPRGLLGLMMQSWLVALFTPVSGFTQLVRLKLQGIGPHDMWGWYDSPVLGAMNGVPHGDGKPGSDKRRVPQFARDPANPNQLVAWFHTRWNCMKPAVKTVLASYRAAGWKEVRKRLYGYVESDTSSSFGSAYDEKIHLCTWADIPRQGTIYEVVDPAPNKPWAVIWFLVDSHERIWQLQEWPCEVINVNGASPGPWAVPSRSERLNGDEGPAYNLPSRSNAAWALMIWEGRRRILEMFKATGGAWQGAVIKRRLVIGMMEGKPVEADEEGEFIEPDLSIMDSRGAKDKFDLVNGTSRVTLIEIMRSAEQVWNPIEFVPAAGDDNSEGAQIIIDHLTAQVYGGAKARINEECTNTRFMFRHRTVPPHREGTTRKDEVCEEWFDLWAYASLTEDGLVFVDRAPRPRTGMTFGVKL